MSDQASRDAAKEKAGLVKEVRKTKSGKEYTVWYSKPADGKTARKRPDTSKKMTTWQFDQRVEWNAPSDYTFTDSKFRAATGIIQYGIYKGGIIYKWELEINSEKTYDYYFTDGTGEVYELNVWNNNYPHSLNYNSDAPQILRVQIYPGPLGGVN